MKENILIIAPDQPDLTTIAATVAAIARYHNVQKLIGDVRESDIQRAVDAGGNRIVWFLTHGGRAGMKLTNSILPPEGVGQYVVSGDFKLCVMSTCDSEEVGNLIVAGGDADMVCTITSHINDVDASRFDVLFAKELFALPEPPEGDLPNFQDAFNRAAGPGATKYRYIRARGAVRAIAVSVNDGLERLRDKFDVFSNRLATVEANQDNLGRTVERLTTQTQQNQAQATANQTSAGQMADMERSLTASQQTVQPSPYTPLFWLLLAAIMGLFVILLLLLSGRSF